MARRIPGQRDQGIAKVLVKSGTAPQTWDVFVKTSETFEIQDLRHILSLEDGKFSRWQDLRRFVLDRAVAEINHLAGFRIGFMPIKRGRSIAAVRLTLGRKDLPELIEAQKELDRTRIGRTAPREGKAVTISDERARWPKASPMRLVWVDKEIR